MNDLTKAVLTLVLIIVLLFIPTKLYGAYKSLQSLGQPENGTLIQLKDDCTNKIDSNQDSGRCALDIAEKSVSAGESPLIAESWLRKQIDGTQDETILKEAFDFAKNKLYPAMKNPLSEKQTYELIASKTTSSDFKTQLKNEEVNVLIAEAKRIYALTDFTEIRSNLPQLKSVLKEAVNTYNQNKNSIDDKQILNPYNARNACSGLTLYYAIPAPSDAKEACSTAARATLAYGCFYYGASYACESCYYYPSNSNPEADACSGYDNKQACEADACNKGSCQWQASDNRCTAVFGVNNYWDSN